MSFGSRLGGLAVLLRCLLQVLTELTTPTSSEMPGRGAFKVRALGALGVGPHDFRDDVGPKGLTVARAVWTEAACQGAFQGAGGGWRARKGCRHGLLKARKPWTCGEMTDFDDDAARVMS